ncbi:methyltransferase domain-containing protein [Motiliproteus sp. MSK22-1]|uniref:class I SAM-dependent methyltransferase n=1 Tax=Motiliproteus sp. MSK22-1 TaxID=1897630 RepID=UPI0009760CE2|nr:methyltransferase domain-containing protein [Motiliproteus sp. MSK22-1]OMH33785.1 hypothetical protein BGP75_12400 [Motiliproteus sp. MSK22-1]
MRRLHFETLNPVCPQCRHSRGISSPLVLAKIIRGTEDDVVEGHLHCTDPSCFLEFPIIDGIPILVPDARKYISDNWHHITAREDFSADIESTLGDCIGPGTAFDATRQHLSTYSWDHYADLDPQEPESQEQQQAGAIIKCLDYAVNKTESCWQGPVIDAGCSVGRTTFELAQITKKPVLGIDLNFSMLRLAQKILRERKVSYPRRRIGVVYDRREFEVNFEEIEQVDFWACDAQTLPFNDDSVTALTAFNLIDCVPSPLSFLTEIARIVETDGTAIIATPYDWSPHATSMEQWIGGHSQRGPDKGSAEPFIRALLTPGAHPQSITGLELVEGINNLAWQTRLHDRCTVNYRVDLLLVRARNSK